MTVIAIALALLLLIATFFTMLSTRNIARKIAETPSSESSSAAIPAPSANPLRLDLPATLPKNIPLPPHAKVTLAKEDKGQWTAIFLTVASLDEVVHFYKKELASNGWTITDQSAAGGLFIIHASSDHDVLVAIGRSENGVTVSLTVSK